MLERIGANSLTSFFANIEFIYKEQRTGDVAVQSVNKKGTFQGQHFSISLKYVKCFHYLKTPCEFTNLTASTFDTCPKNDMHSHEMKSWLHQGA